MRIAFFSPLNPQKSGISDYSEELLPHLASGADIDLFVDGFRPTSEQVFQGFRLFDYRTEPDSLRRLSEYDAVIYHMGNDPRYHTGIYETMRAFPGTIVFHDFAFQFFFYYLARERGQMNIYLDELEACHGTEARLIAEEAMAQGLKPPQMNVPITYPLNLRLARMAEGVIVHSNWCKTRFEKIAPFVPVRHINMHATPRAAHARTAHAPANGVTRIASFGHVTPEKGIERTLKALASLQNEHNFHYTLVGEPSRFFDVHELARSAGLKNRLTVTGYVSLAEFERLIAETDIAINLRERTAGETSASLCRVMAAGVPAIVSNVGWFSELPDDAVVKIDEDEFGDALLRAYLKRLIEDTGLRTSIGLNARRHILTEHDIRRSAEAYLSFTREIIGARARNRFVQGVSRELAHLGIKDSDEDFMRGVALEIAMLAPAPATIDATAPANDSSESVQAINTPAGTLAQSQTSAPGRLGKLEGIDYKRAALEYPTKLDAGRRHYLLTKPFDNLARRPLKYSGDGLDAETHRHFCDFANLARQLGLPAGSRILDVGCGSGWLSEYFARLGYDVCGIDISPVLIEMARERLRRVPYPVDTETPLRCRFETHDIESAPFPETFDAIICYDSLHHFEDERAAVSHLCMMLEYGGLLFIMEGDRPEEGSRGEKELLETMLEFGTLESPYTRDYLLSLLKENGFCIVGDYVSVNGLFHRELIEDGRVLIERPEVTYLLCKKVAAPDSPRRFNDSRDSEGLSARLSLNSAWTGHAAPSESVRAELSIQNTGSAIWLVGPAALKGAVMIGLKIIDAGGSLVFESHGTPPIKRALAPNEGARVAIEFQAPSEPGRYELKIDLVAQHVCWFEQRGSEPLVLPLVVR